MIERLLQKQVEYLLQGFPAVAILGARQVGKTTLAHTLAQKHHPKPLYLDLERPSDRAKLSDPEHYLQSHLHHLVMMDEIWRFPHLFQILRSLIDERRQKGISSNQYLLLGSASVDLLKQSSESLAGRICYTELTPLNLLEIGPSEQETLWVRGGFPDSYLALNDALSLSWRESLIRTYLEREIPLLGPQIPAETLRRFWSMLAYTQGELFNASRLATNLGVSAPTISRYLDVLVDLFLVRILRPWSHNGGKRLVKSPKVYIRDSGLLHTLLSLKTQEDILAHPIVGGSWEGFVIENIASVLGSKANLWFYRTLAGAEIDLLIEYSSLKKIAIAIKRSLTPIPSKGLHYAIEDIQPAKTFIVYPGQGRYRLSDKIEVISLEALLQQELS